MTNFLTYKIICGDDSGAPVFQKLAQWWDSAKTIDDTYSGPEFYWAFFQLGDFGKADMTIVKWEVWSTWRLKNPVEMDKGAFVGVTCGLFFYNPEDSDSFNQLKVSIDVFLQKRKSEKPLIVVVALYDHIAYNEATIEDQPFLEDQKSFMEINGAHLLYFPDSLIEEDLRSSLQQIYRLFLEALTPDLTSELDIANNFWYLTIPELRAILLAERNGIKLPSRHLPPAQRDEILSEAYPQMTEEESPELIPEGISGEALTNVAISPEGEIVPITPEMTKEEIMDLVRQGYKLPEWVVIPRHCPKCYNQNQRLIREVIDTSVVLMQNPPIYGTKFVCGNCGHSWR